MKVCHVANRYGSSPPQRQHFSLPFEVICYMIANPLSPEGCDKLQKTCRYMYWLNKYNIVVLNETVTSLNSYDNHRWDEIYLNDYKDINIWLIGGFHVGLTISENISRCSLKELQIRNKDLSVRELDFLSEGERITFLRLIKVNIRDENGALVPIDKVLSKMPNIRILDYSCNKNEMFTTETFQRMNSLKFNTGFRCFELKIFKLSEDADISLLSQFMMKNATHDSFYDIGLRFENSRSHHSKLISAVKALRKDATIKLRYVITYSNYDW